MWTAYDRSSRARNRGSIGSGGKALNARAVDRRSKGCRIAVRGRAEGDRISVND
ncbi:MAG: hypothetical protein JWN15_2969, partial [Firmicutes bacterium]|nr:hypothetical protein [Bacillota bacterium]